MSGAGLIGCDQPLAQAYDLALVDLDGVARRGDQPIDHASASLAQAGDWGMALMYATNNASMSPGDVSTQLNGLGIACQDQDIVTSAQAAAALLAQRLEPGSPVLVVGGAGLRDAVTAEGFICLTVADMQAQRDAVQRDSVQGGPGQAGLQATVKPAAVVQGFSPDLTWKDLAEAAYAVAAGAWYVASNMDMSLPTAQGYAPGNGSLVSAVVAATGVTPDAAGKPSPAIYQLAVDRRTARNPLVIGDRLDTDLAGARSAGYAGLHVLTGVSSARDDVLADASFRPHFIGADLQALLVPHPVPQARGQGWWGIGDRQARVVDGRLELDAQGPVGIDIVRCACAAAWESADAGHRVDPASVPEFSV